MPSLLAVGMWAMMPGATSVVQGTLSERTHTRHHTAVEARDMTDSETNALMVRVIGCGDIEYNLLY